MSIYPNTPFESTFLTDSNILTILEKIPNNTQELIRPVDVRDSLFTIWDNIAFKKGATGGIKYLGISQSNENYLEEFMNGDGLPVLIGRPTINGSSSSVLSGLLAESTDLFIYNSKSDSHAPQETSIKVLAGTDASLFSTAPIIKGLHDPINDSINLFLENDNGDILLIGGASGSSISLSSNNLSLDFNTIDLNTPDGILKPGGEVYDVQVKIDECKFGGIDTSGTTEGYLLTLEDFNGNLIPTWKKPFLEDIIPPLDTVLGNGNFSGGNDIIISEGDSILFDDDLESDFKISRNKIDNSLVLDANRLKFIIDGLSPSNKCLKTDSNGFITFEDCSDVGDLNLNDVLSNGNTTDGESIYFTQESDIIAFYSDGPNIPLSIVGGFRYDISTNNDYNFIEIATSNSKRPNSQTLFGSRLRLALDTTIVPEHILPGSGDTKFVKIDSEGFILYDDVSSLAANLSSVLSVGNQTSNNNIIVSEDDKVQFGSSSYIEFSSGFLRIDGASANVRIDAINHQNDSFLVTDSNGDLSFEPIANFGGNQNLETVLGVGNQTGTNQSIEFTGYGSIDNMGDYLKLSTIDSRRMQFNLDDTVTEHELPTTGNTKFIKVDSSGLLEYSDGSNFIQNLNSVLSELNLTNGENIIFNTIGDKIGFGNPLSLIGEISHQANYLEIITNSSSGLKLSIGSAILPQVGNTRFVKVGSDGLVEYSDGTEIEQSFNQTLSIGNLTDGEDMIISTGDKIGFGDVGNLNGEIKTGNLNGSDYIEILTSNENRLRFSLDSSILSEHELPQLGDTKFLKINSEGFIEYSSDLNSISTLTQILNKGNSTDGENISISENDSIVFNYSSTVVGGVMAGNINGDNYLEIITSNSTGNRLKLTLDNSITPEHELPTGNNTKFVKVDSNGFILYDSGSNPMQDLASVLAQGNQTSGNTIRVSNSDNITFFDSSNNIGSTLEFNPPLNNQSSPSGRFDIKSVDGLVNIESQEVRIEINGQAPSNNILGTNSTGFLEYKSSFNAHQIEFITTQLLLTPQNAGDTTYVIDSQDNVEIRITDNTMSIGEHIEIHVIGGSFSFVEITPIVPIINYTSSSTFNTPDSVKLRRISANQYLLMQYA